MIRRLAEALYVRRLRRQVAGGPVPRHVAIIMDGNRRWARRSGLRDVSLGHAKGADHVADVLRWCVTAGIRYVTLFVVSSDNLRKRPLREITALMELIERTVAERMVGWTGEWEIHAVGRLQLLPDSTAQALRRAEQQTRGHDAGHVLTIAVGYAGHEEIVDALRALLGNAAAGGVPLAALAETLTTDDIASHMATRHEPAPDLVIRTGGERRLSGFLIWQSVHADFFFCDAYWPRFRQLDFLRALRSYARRYRPPG